MATVTPKSQRRQRGEGGLSRRSSDGLWVGTVDLGISGDGKRRRKTVASKDYRRAVQKLRDLRRQVQDAGGSIPTGSTTLTQWLEQWLTQIVKPRVRPNTYVQYASDAHLHIAPAIGRHRLDRLTPTHVRDMHRHITEKGLSPTSVLRCHAVLRKALTDAQREGIVTRNVAALVDRPRKAISNRRSLTATEALAVLAHVAQEPNGSRWAAALLTGARQGELLGLERDRVTEVLDLSWQLQRLDYRHGCDGCGRRAGSCPLRELDVPTGYEYRQLHGGLALTRPKSAAGHRVIPLVEPLASILSRHLAATSNPYGLVWATPAGKPIDPSNDSRAWKDVTGAVGISDVPLHGARHTAATLLLEAGQDAHVIKTLLGHTDVSQTRQYQTVNLTLARAAMTALGDTLKLPGKGNTTDPHTTSPSRTEPTSP